MDTLNPDITFMILDHLGSQDLLSYSQVNQTCRQRARDYVDHQLKRRDVGLEAVLLHLDTVPKETWSQMEFRLKIEERRSQKVPKDLLTAIKKLFSLREVLQTRKQIVHQKLPVDIHFNRDLVTQRPLHLVARRVNSKGLPRQVIALSGNCQIEKLMGEITPGLFVFSLDIMVVPGRTWHASPEAKIFVRIQDQNAVRSQTTNWSINFNEIENYVGPTANLKRIHKNWFKISRTMLVNTEGTIYFGMVLNCNWRRSIYGGAARSIYIDSITISRV